MKSEGRSEKKDGISASRTINAAIFSSHTWLAKISHYGSLNVGSRLLRDDATLSEDIFVMSD